MSWESELGKTVKYGRWPNPFRNMMKSIEVLACEGTFEAMFSMYTLAFANYFFTTFVPGPWEIARKTFTGSYRCGFYSRFRLKSPLDIVWRDGRTGRALGSILSPVTRGAFYLWAGGAIWDALQTWTSLMYAQEMCDWDGNTTVLANAVAPIQNNPTSGGVAFAEVIYDPRNRADPNVCEVVVQYEVKWQAHIVGYIIANSEQITNCNVGITVNNVTYILASPGTINPGEAVEFAVSMQGLDPFLVAQPYFECNVETFGPDFGLCHVTRFIVNAFPPSYPWEPIHNLQDFRGPAPEPYLCKYYE